MVVGWYIGLLGIVAGLIGAVFFLSSIFRLSGELKKSMYFLVMASILYVVFSSIMILFGIVKYEIGNAWWQIVPVLYFVSSVLYAIGSVMLVRLLENLQENKK